ncbi:peptidoglycan DD-metalloendopeptidase family protein [Phormidesmis sp. 146-33]
MDITLVILQLLIPLGLLVWQGASPSRSQIGWLLKTLLILGYLVAIALAGLWMVVPWWIPYLYLVIWLVLVIATFRQARRQPRFPQHSGWGWAKVGLCGAIAGLFWALTLHIWTGHFLPPVSPVSLEFPLRNGTYYIANGGSKEVLNAHLDLVRSKRFQELRGTMYALDIVKLNFVGTHASELQPSDPAQYAIFGEPVHAPCSGVVLQSVNTMPDMSPPALDEKNERGNFVLMQCEQNQVVVFMAHLKQGSVKVAADDLVSVGQQLAEVGNSGNSGEPHLHINAQRPGSSPTTFDGDPLPILFSNQYLARGSRVET